MAMINGILMLFEVLLPFNRYKILLISLILIVLSVALLFFGNFFMLMKMPILNYVISLGLIFTIFSISKMIIFR